MRDRYGNFEAVKAILDDFGPEEGKRLEWDGMQQTEAVATAPETIFHDSTNIHEPIKPVETIIFHDSTAAAAAAAGEIVFVHVEHIVPSTAPAAEINFFTRLPQQQQQQQQQQQDEKPSSFMLTTLSHPTMT